MTPRLPSSKKWTAVPAELCTQIRDVFAENFAEQRALGTFLVEGRFYSNELLLRLGFLPKGRLRQANFEVSIDFAPEKQNALELVHLAVDCIASLIADYFESDQELDSFPIEWKSYKVEKREIFVQVSTVNSSLEADADRLLGAASEDLVQGDDAEIEETVAKRAVVTMLGLDKAEDGDIVSRDDANGDDADGDSAAGDENGADDIADDTADDVEETNNDDPDKIH